MSSPVAKHAKSIMATTYKVSDKKAGVQIVGNAEMLERVESIKWFFRIFNRLNAGVENVLN